MGEKRHRYLCIYVPCHIFAVRTRIATPNTTAFCCQHLSVFGESTPMFNIRESISVRIRLKEPRFYLSNATITCSEKKVQLLFLTEKSSLRKNKGTLTMTSRLSGVTHLTRSLAQKSPCQRSALADAGIEVVFVVTEALKCADRSARTG